MRTAGVDHVRPTRLATLFTTGTNGATATSGWGGPRAGGGAPTKPLVHHVFATSFRSHRHSQLLDDDDSLLRLKFPGDDPDGPYLFGLIDLQLLYRHETRVRRRASIAASFESAVRRWFGASTRHRGPRLSISTTTRARAPGPTAKSRRTGRHGKTA